LSVYLDASVLLPTLIDEPGSEAVERFLAQVDDGLIISEFAATEVASGVSRLVRMRMIASDVAARRLSIFDAWRADESQSIDIEGADVRAASAIVRRFEMMLRAPEALHIAVCRRLDARLATLDVRLADAASKLGVMIAPI
jgi:predicted nucleic acid-binding protein